MERETKNSFGFSWADEVDREEREEEQKAGRGVCAPEKPNPFGAARPREVVLEEKGVDWRKVDLELDKNSNLRKEKAKEKIYAVTSSSSRKQEQSSSLRLRCPDQKKSDTRKARSSCLGHQRRNPTLLVPSKFPLLIPQMRASHTARLDGGFPYPCEMVHHANGLMMQHRPMHAGRATTMLTGPNYNMEAMYDRRENEFRFKRKLYGDGLIGGRRQDMQMRNYVQERRYIDETAEMQAHGKRRILGDHEMEMERSFLGKRPDVCEEYYGYEPQRRNCDQVMMSQHCYEVKLGARSMVEARDGDRARRDDLVVATSKPSNSHRGRKRKGTKK